MTDLSWVPHGFCLNWNPYLLWSLIGSDALIAIAYFAIPLSLLVYSRQLFLSSTLPRQFYQIIGLFSAFVVCCGVSHVVEIVTLFLPVYGISVVTKVITAIVSLAAAIWLPPFASESLDAIQRSQVAQSQSHVRELFIEASPFPIYCKRASDSQMLWLNAACSRAIGKPATAVIGQIDTDFLIDQAQAAKILQNDRLVERDGRAEFMEVVVDATGQPRTYYTLKFRFVEPLTQEVCIGGFSLDVTDQQTVQGRLVIANEKLQEKESRLGLMVLNLNLISEMSARLNRCDDYDEAGEVVRVAGRKLFPYLAGELFLIDNSRTYAQQRFSWGGETGSEPGFVPTACRSIKDGKVHYCESPEVEVVCQHLHQPVSGSHLCVPLFSHGKDAQSLGVLHLRRDRPLTNVEIEIAEIVGQQLGQALSSLNDRKAVAEMLIRDPLTGLLNRRHLDETFPRELARAERAKNSIGILFLDLDSFGLWNKTYGQNVGDLVLREVGRIVRSYCRQTDTGAFGSRAGGEEIIVLLPDCNLTHAASKAESLRQLIADIALQHQGQTLGQVTASIGVAAFPHHGATPEDLIAAADAAMRQAKASGKNQVRVAG